MPEYAAGLRSDPPLSVPSANGVIPQASATAAPPLDPPQLDRRLMAAERVDPQIVFIEVVDQIVDFAVSVG